MRKIVSIVAPAYNDEAVVSYFYERVLKIMNSLNSYDYEIVIVNDGSKDNTYHIVKQICDNDNKVKLIDLSRNYGHEIALTAGIDHAHGDAVILMDIDLQDPPELIPELLEYYEQGYEVVNARRASRDGETFMKKFTAKMFYKIIAKANKKINIPENVGNYRLISKTVVDALKQLRENHRFTRGLISWAGYKTIMVDFHRESRVAGVSKYNWKGMINYAVEGFTSFTTTPLRFSIYLGIGVSLGSLLYIIVLLLGTMFQWMIDIKFHLFTIVMLTLFALQSIMIGILGEYLGRVFNETKFRPMYFVQEIVNDK